MGDGGIFKACHAADDLVERAVASAGIQPDLLPGFTGAARNGFAVAGGFGDTDLIGKTLCAADPLDILRIARRMVGFSGGGIQNKNMLHCGNFLLR